jgi:hypothetical protein
MERLPIKILVGGLKNRSYAVTAPVQSALIGIVISSRIG